MPKLKWTWQSPNMRCPICGSRLRASVKLLSAQLRTVGQSPTFGTSCADTAPRDIGQDMKQDTCGDTKPLEKKRKRDRNE